MAYSAADLDDWELLIDPETAEDEESKSVMGEAANDSDDDSIKVDYFALESNALYPNRGASSGNLQFFEVPQSPVVTAAVEEVEDSLIDSKFGKPSSDDCKFGVESKKETTLGEIECLKCDSQIFMSDESVDGKKEQLLGAIFGGDDSMGAVVVEVGKDDLCLEKPSQPEEFLRLAHIKHVCNDSEVLSSGELLTGQREKLGGSGIGDSFSVVKENMNGMETEGLEMANENISELESEQLAKMNDKSSDALVTGDEDISSKDVPPVEGEKGRIIWWKLPMEFLKFCAFRVKPIWSISVVATLLGAFMLTKKLYRMKHKSRSMPLKISFDEKKANHLKIQAARLNEAFSVMKRAPVLRTSMLANNGLSPWPLVGSQ